MWSIDNKVALASHRATDDDTANSDSFFIALETVNTPIIEKTIFTLFTSLEIDAFGIEQVWNATNRHIFVWVHGWLPV